MRVFIIDSDRQPLAPTTPKRARRLLKSKKAAILRRFPFTIILKHEILEPTVPMELKNDPGNTTGMALVAPHKSGKVVTVAANIKHRSFQIKDSLRKRARVRRSRRFRKTRYRKARFLNRKRSKGWLPPSLLHRVQTTMTWIKRFMRYAPIGHISMELNKFDPHKMLNPDISGIEYQQGTLAGYEIRQYLLTKWDYGCAYCKAHSVPLQVEHIIPKARNGSNSVTNLVMACKPCNKKKGTQTAKEFGFPDIQAQARKPLREAAYMNAVRLRLKAEIEKLGISCSFASGYQTQMNRIQQKYPKDHWVDAACVGDTGASVKLESMEYLDIKCTGHGRRRMSNVDENGFPIGKPKERRKMYFGFQTGDYVKANVTKGKKTGKYTGRVTCRKNGSFDTMTKSRKIQGIGYKYFEFLQKSDGYFIAANLAHEFIRGLPENPRNTKVVILKSKKDH